MLVAVKSDIKCRPLSKNLYWLSHMGNMVILLLVYPY